MFALRCFGSVGSGPITYARIFRKIEMSLQNQYESSQHPPPLSSAEPERDHIVFSFKLRDYPNPVQPAFILVQVKSHRFESEFN
jgi:hypothetical protein